MDTTTQPTWYDSIVNAFNNTASTVAQASVDVQTIQTVTSSPSTPVTPTPPPQFGASLGAVSASPMMIMGAVALVGLAILYKVKG